MKRRRTNNKSTLRALSRIAYERELKNTLSVLAAKFDDWKMSRVTSFQMEEFVHKYERDESRQLWSLYNSSSLHSIVARAVAIELLSDKEVGTTIIKLLAEQIAFFQSGHHKNVSGSVENKQSAA
jgi:hypothetical protein